jgi:hypothetical protein
MAKGVTHNHEWYALGQKQGCTTMAQVMESDGRWQPGAFQHDFEPPMQVSGLHQCPDAGRKDQPVFLPLLARPLAVLVCPMLAENLQEQGWYGQCPDA